MVDVCKCTDERWLPVVGLESLYLVSSCGRVWSLGRAVTNSMGKTMRYKPKMMTQRPQPYGHMIVNLSPGDGRKMIAAKVHQLVALAFIGPRPDGQCVCHGDGDATNNHVPNLRWGTPKANAADSIRHGTHHLANIEVCSWGHALVEPNLLAGRFRKTGVRRCLSCSRVWNNERKAARDGRALEGTTQERADKVYQQLMSGEAPRRPRNAKKMTAEQAREIKRALATGETQAAIAERFSITQAMVSEIKRGRSWASVTV